MDNNKSSALTFDTVDVHRKSHGSMPYGNIKLHLFQASGVRGKLFEAENWDFSLSKEGGRRPNIYILKSLVGAGIKCSFDISDEFLLELHDWLGPVVEDIRAEQLRQREEKGYVG